MGYASKTLHPLPNLYTHSANLILPNFYLQSTILTFPFAAKQIPSGDKGESKRSGEGAPGMGMGSSSIKFFARGSPAAGDFLLRRQEKGTKEKATLVRRHLRGVPVLLGVSQGGNYTQCHEASVRKNGGGDCLRRSYASESSQLCLSPAPLLATSPL